MKKILKYGGLVVAVFILAVAIRNIYAGRYVEVKDADLVYYPQKVEDSKNGYLILIPILKQISREKLSDEIRDLLKDEDKIDLALASKFLKKHSDLLAIWSASLNYPSFQIPQKEKLDEDFYLLSLAKLESLNIKLLLSRNQFKVAEKEMEKLYRYGYLLQNSDGPNIYARVGSYIKDRALQLIQEWTLESNLDASMYLKVSEWIEKYSDNSGISKSFRIEYTHMKKLISGTVEEFLKRDQKNAALLAEYKKNPRMMRFLFNENATINERAKYSRYVIKNLNRTFIRSNENLTGPKEFNCSDFLCGNTIGKIMLGITSVNYGGVIKYTFQVEAKSRLAKLLLAIKAYYVENNSLPSTLEELVPKYIASIPLDPFDGKSLKYSFRDRKIYSAGSDNKNENLFINLNFK